MDLLTWILTAFSAITGGTAFYSLFLFRKQQGRFKNAEAFEKEVTALKQTIQTMQQQVEWQEKRLSEMQKLIINKESYIATLTADKSTLEVKHAKNKSAINRAYGCPFCDTPANCPVLMQRAQNEDEYLKRIENNVQSNSK